MSKETDDKLLTELFKQYRQMMFRIALGILHNEPDAEDAVQDAFLSIINNLEKISLIPCTEMKFYFVTIIENAAINKINKSNRHPLENIEEHCEFFSDYSVEDEADKKFLLREIKSALNELSDRDYSIMYLYVFNQMKPKEIAEELGISEKNIHTYIERAKKRLVKILNERGIYYDI